jgi:hypothetical protein
MRELRAQALSTRRKQWNLQATFRIAKFRLPSYLALCQKHWELCHGRRHSGKRVLPQGSSSPNHRREDARHRRLLAGRLYLQPQSPIHQKAGLALMITHSDQQQRSTARKWAQAVPLATVNLQNLLLTSSTSRPILYPGRRDRVMVDSSDEKIDRRTYTAPQLMHTFYMQGEQLEKR